MIEDVLRQMPVGVVVTDLEGRLVLGNEATDALIGRPVTDSSGQPAYLPRRPDGQAYHWEELPIAEALRTQVAVLDRELAVRGPDGEERVLAVSAAPVRGAAGEVARAVAVLRDVTDERATERQRAQLQFRLVRLQEITASLAAARTPEQVLDVVLSQVVDGVGAQAGSAVLLDDDARTLEVVAAVGYGPAVLRHSLVLGIDDPHPIAAAVRSGEPEVHRDSGDLAAAYPNLAEQAGPAGNAAWAAVPLVTEAQTVGALGLSFAQARDFDEAEMAFLRAVATQCAQALDRSRLYKEEAAAWAQAEAAQERLAFLSQVSDILASSLDPQRTMTNIAELAVPRLGEWCVVALFDRDGALVPQAVSHIDAAKTANVWRLVKRWPARPEAAAGPGAVARSGRAELYRHVSDDVLQRLAENDDHLEALRESGICAGIIVPLRARGRTLGTLAVANESGRPATETELALAEEVATRAAVAIDNARMFAERSHVSRSLQASLLPPRLPDVPGVDVGADYRAAGSGVEVGGDFYDILDLPDGRWLFVVGDVCGKGIEAAAVTGIARHTIRAVAASGASPSESLRHLNRALRRAERERGAETADPQFATVAAVALEPRPGGAIATVCAAGHPLPLRRRGDGSVEPVGTPGMAVGIFDDPDFSDERVELSAGEALVFLTDGLLERRAGSAYFEDVVEEVIRAASAEDAATIAGRLRGEAESFSPEPPADDMAVLVLCIRGA